MHRNIILADSIENNLLERASFFKKNNFTVLHAASGAEILKHLKQHSVEIIITHDNLLDIDAIYLCTFIKSKQTDLVYFLLSDTTLNDEQLINSFEAGIDEVFETSISNKLLLYFIEKKLNKPIENILLNKVTTENAVIEIDSEKFTFLFNNQNVVLTKREFEIIQLLITKKGKVFNRTEIINKIWGDAMMFGERAIDVHIRKIRQKTNDSFITTIKGLGYKIA